jgi:hypothetical protein
MMAMLFSIVDSKFGKSSTYEFNTDLELLLNKLFLHLALANGITSNPYFSMHTCTYSNLCMHCVGNVGVLVT